MKKYIWGITYSIALIVFTTYVMLDTFVIERAYTEVPENSSSSLSEITDNTSQSNDDNSAITLTDTTYQDDNISIAINEYRYKDTTVYVANVQLSSADYLQTAFAKGTYGKNVTQKTSEIAETNNAILAINGDYYGAQEIGYVLRNGILYRSVSDSDQEDLVIHKDGSFEIINEVNISADSLYNGGARQILSFGPALVEDGKISVTTQDEVGKAMASNPRTAIGIIDELHYVFVVSDGRTSESEGLSLYELAAFMQTLNVSIAYNLDGGGSSTMVFNGEVINNPTTNGKKIKERSVSDIVFIGYGN